jgi:uncharacterized protein YdhG (YjbR/CyaY superfamily)
MQSYKNINEYLKTLQEPVLGKFLEMKKISDSVLAKNKKLEGKVFEEIKYGIPTYVLKEGKKSKNLFHLGAFKTHVSIFPGPKVIKFYEKDLKKLETSKGTIKFPLESKLPKVLISKIVKKALS